MKRSLLLVQEQRRCSKSPLVVLTQLAKAYALSIQNHCTGECSKLLLVAHGGLLKANGGEGHGKVLHLLLELLNLRRRLQASANAKI